MTEYTEADIRELSGRELKAAVLHIVQKKEVFQMQDGLYIQGPTGSVVSLSSLPMGLEWCVPELMGPGKVLGGWKLHYNPLVSMWCIDDPCDELTWEESADPATAIQRAACIVALRE